MTLDQLTDLFKWMTAINFGLFLFSALLSMALKDFIAKMHGKLFGIEAEQVAVVMYGFLGAYKIAFIMFNLVPWLALSIIG
jgi:hypothetical protein